MGVLIETLERRLKLKDLGSLKKILGMELFRSRSSNRFIISQHKYVLDLIARISMNECTSSPTPIVSTTWLNSYEGVPFSDTILYQSRVGAILYSVHTRSDISYVMNKSCQFVQRPSTIHWTTVKGVLQYLKGTSKFGLEPR